LNVRSLPTLGSDHFGSTDDPIYCFFLTLALRRRWLGPSISLSDYVDGVLTLVSVPRREFVGLVPGIKGLELAKTLLR
jgi:hypothetical protein